MVTTAASVQWTVVGTEVEALALEYSWIKEFDPRFNVKYRDDKSYPYLAVTLADEFPRVQVMRGAKRPGTRYFGPYAHAWAIRETVDLLLRVFPVRTCSAGVFKRARQQGRPCLLGYIDKCSAPCVGRISPDDHHALARGLLRLHGGRHRQVHATARPPRMKEAAAELDYERAARLRDDIATLAAGDREERRRARRTARTRTSSRWPATSSRPRSRCSTCATAASAVSAAGSSRRSRTSPTPSSSSTCSSRSTAREAAAGDGGAGVVGASRARCSCRCCRPTSTRCRRG